VTEGAQEAEATSRKGRLTRGVRMAHPPSTSHAGPKQGARRRVLPGMCRVAPAAAITACATAAGSWGP
jgi:hypothetical protein